MRIVGGTVVTPEGLREADIVLAGAQIAALEQPRPPGAGDVDARGLVVLPGGVDPHTHMLADVVAAARAAAWGGTTTAYTFTLPRDGESPAQALVRAREEEAPRAAVDVVPVASYFDPENLDLADIEELRRLGSPGLQIFLDFPELGLMVDDRRFYEVLRDCGKAGLLPQVVCENAGGVEARTAELVAAGKRGLPYFAVARAPELEAEAVNRSIALAGLAGTPVYLVHLSTAEGVALAREAKARGQEVYLELCTHHLVLDDSVFARPDGERFLCVPPLRPREHVEALWDAVADGTVDAIGSDHGQALFQPAPADDFTGLPYGLPGIEARLPVVLSEGTRRSVPLERLVDCLCAAPARIFGAASKGELRPAADADLVLWDPAGSWTVPKALHDGRGFTPYAGLELTGRLRGVLRAGAWLSTP